jgi:hypothetical protein
MVNWGSAFYDHFAKYHGGEPKKRSIYKQSEETPSIQILRYENVFEGCTVFSSLGISNYVSLLGTVAEASLVTDFAPDESESILANTLFHIINEKIEFGRGVSINGVSNINKEFSKAFDKNALYFTTPYAFPEGYERVITPGATGEGLIFLSFFISQREHEYFVANGAEKFENMLVDCNVDPFDLKRVSVI